MKKRIVLLFAVVLLVLAMPVFTQEPNPASDFKVTLNDKGDGVVITDYVGNSPTVIIPSKIEGYPVLKIDGSLYGGCFYRKSNVTSVVIPDTVKEIAVNAFTGSAITSIHLPASVELISALAFNGCSRLTSVIIDNPRLNVKSVSDGSYRYTVPFNNCSALSSLTLPEGMTEIPPYLVSRCRKLTTVIIPNSVTVIGNYAFDQCGLESVTLPNGLQKIGIYAFNDNCLASITLPASIKEIGIGAFYDNYLTEVIIPESVSSIRFPIAIGQYDYAFRRNKLNLSSQAALRKVGYTWAFEN